MYTLICSWSQAKTGSLRSRESKLKTCLLLEEVSWQHISCDFPSINHFIFFNKMLQFMHLYPYCVSYSVSLFLSGFNLSLRHSFLERIGF